MGTIVENYVNSWKSAQLLVHFYKRKRDMWIQFFPHKKAIVHFKQQIKKQNFE